jgi:hypothetical protein
MALRTGELSKRAENRHRREHNRPAGKRTAHQSDFKVLNESDTAGLRSLSGPG